MSRSASPIPPASPYVGATLAMYPAPNSHGGMGNFIAWDNIRAKSKWSLPEQFRSGRGRWQRRAAWSLRHA